MEWYAKVILSIAVIATLWFIATQAAAKNPQQDHLCADGEFRPGPMERCWCRDQWWGCGR